MGKRKCIATIKKYKKRCGTVVPKVQGPCTVGASADQGKQSLPDPAGSTCLDRRTHSVQDPVEEPVTGETERLAPVAPSYNFDDAEGKVCVAIGDSVNYRNADLYNFQSGRFIPQSKNVMLDAVQTFCNWISPAFSTKEIRMYLPQEHLSNFQKIAELMGKNAVLQEDYVLVMLK